jgi:hypothetical protein
MSRTLTYNLPDHLYSNQRTQGKTGTQLFNGPEELILHLEKSDGSIFESFAPGEEHDRPLALNLDRVVFTAQNDEDRIKIALIYGGLEVPKVYEVDIGPEDYPNTTIKDPTDIREVYDEAAVMRDYTAPLQFRVQSRDRSDEWVRKVRNALLTASDGKISEDMPESLKQAWLDYRQKLRDLPIDMAEVPNFLIRFPRSPIETYDPVFEDPHVDVIRIADRTPTDIEKMRQLPPGVY